MIEKLKNMEIDGRSILGSDSISANHACSINYNMRGYAKRAVTLRPAARRHSPRILMLFYEHKTLEKKKKKIHCTQISR